MFEILGNQQQIDGHNITNIYGSSPTYSPISCWRFKTSNTVYNTYILLVCVLYNVKYSVVYDILQSVSTDIQCTLCCSLIFGMEVNWRSRLAKRMQKAFNHPLSFNTLNLGPTRCIRIQLHETEHVSNRNSVMNFQ